MSHGQLSGMLVIERDIGNALNMVVAGYGHHGNRDRVLDQRVKGNDSLRAAAYQHPHVFIHQFLLMPVMGGEIKVSCPEKLVPDAAHDLGMIAVAKLGHQNANSMSPTIAQRTR